MERTVHFSLGNNFGNTLGSLAQEHLIYNFNPEKALDVFESGLGMPREYALMALKGEEYVIRVAEDGNSVELCDRTEEDTYPKLNANDLAKFWADGICEEGESLIFSITRIYRNSDNEIYAELGLKDIYNILSENADISDLVERMKEQLEDMLDNDSSEGNAVRKVQFMKFFDTWKVSVKKKIDILRFIKENELYADLEDFEHNLRVIENQVIDTVTFFEKERMQNTLLGVNTFDNVPDYLVDFAKERLTKENEYVWECKSNDQADALWVSPNGKAYGACGAIRDMLHLEIADWLKEKGFINPDEDSFSTDAYLEEQGWLKIHGNQVLFDPYAKERSYSYPSNFLTDEQIKFVYEWFKDKDSVLFCGYQNKGISYINWKNMDDLMRNQLFQY